MGRNKWQSMRMLDTADRDLKQQGTILVVFVQFSEVVVALEQFLLDIYLKGFDQEIKNKFWPSEIGTYLMFPWNLSVSKFISKKFIIKKFISKIAPGLLCPDSICFST